MQFVNQYSYVLLSLFVASVSAVAVYFWLPDPGGVLLLILLGVTLFAVGVALRYPAADTVDSEGLAAQLKRGVPVFIMVYSNF